jgi:hypothetical protein
MTREKTVTVTICDGCGVDCDYPHTCIECGKNFCYECSRTKATEYQHAVHFRGSDDGLFCHPCEEKLMNRPTPIFAAFLKIKNLRSEIQVSQAANGVRFLFLDAAMQERAATAENELKISASGRQREIGGAGRVEGEGDA